MLEPRVCGTELAFQSGLTSQDSSGLKQGTAGKALKAPSSSLSLGPSSQPHRQAGCCEERKSVWLPVPPQEAGLAGELGTPPTHAPQSKPVHIHILPSLARGFSRA